MKCDQLDLATIQATMSKLSLLFLDKIELFEEIDSTNDYLLRILQHSKEKNFISKHCCIAAIQTKGRGRKPGYSWIIPSGQSSLALSLLWQFNIINNLNLAGLSLVSGIAVAYALKNIGIEVKLKWPNDIVWHNRKLGGILVESFIHNKIAQTIVGIGLNVDFSFIDNFSINCLINQPWVDLREIIRTDTNIYKLLSRNKITAYIVNSLVITFLEFQKYGFSYFTEHWSHFDSLLDKHVILTSIDNKKVTGIARGVDRHGALLIEDHISKYTKKYYSGEISLRLSE